MMVKQNVSKSCLEKEWKKQKDDLYDRAQRRLAKLIDETLNLLQIMNLEEPGKFKEEWESTFEKLQKEGKGVLN